MSDELALEHAISETLGAGERPTDALGVQLERASEPTPGALPATEDETPAPSLALPFLRTLEESPVVAAASEGEPAPSASVGAVEDDLANEPALTDASTEEAPTSDESLPWLAVPADESHRSAPRVEHEITTPTFLIAGAYEMEEMRRPTAEETPSGAATTSASAESSTIVGANLAVAEALEAVARRVRGGELRVPAAEPTAGEAGALAAVLAVLLGVRS